MLVKAGFRVIAPDLRGFGESDKPEGVENYTLQKVQSDVVEILDQLHVNRYSPECFIFFALDISCLGRIWVFYFQDAVFTWVWMALIQHKARYKSTCLDFKHELDLLSLNCVTQA